MRKEKKGKEKVDGYFSISFLVFRSLMSFAIAIWSSNSINTLLNQIFKNESEFMWHWKLMTEFLCECYSKMRTEHFHKRFISELSRNYKSGLYYTIDLSS